MTSPQLAPTKRGRVGFTSESKALGALRSRRDWNRSQPQLVPIQFLDAKTAAFILKFLGIPHGFVTNKSSLSHRYCAIYWFVSIRVMWWSYDVWSRSSVFIHMIRYWPDVWLNSWSASGLICVFACDQWVPSSFDLFFLLQCSFQPPARCTAMTGSGLDFCTASNCSRSELDCYNWNSLLALGIYYCFMNWLVTIWLLQHMWLFT